MNKLFKLAKRKKKLQEKASKIQGKIKKVNEEALSYRGKQGGKADLFISCLVNNLHFEVER